MTFQMTRYSNDEDDERCIKFCREGSKQNKMEGVVSLLSWYQPMNIFTYQDTNFILLSIACLHVENHIIVNLSIAVM